MPGNLTRSWVDRYDVEHLGAASQHWTAMGQLLEYHAEGIHSETLRPGGTLWEGSGADAAADRAWGDVVTARGAADHMYSGATIARTGADDLAWAKRQAQQAITDAEADGFRVAEDLSISDPSTTSMMRTTVARQQQMAAHAADIANKVAALATMDQQVGTQVNEAMAPLGQVSFADFASPAPRQPGGPGTNVHLVDYAAGGQDPRLPKPAFDPRNPFIDDPRFGTWVDATPPPHAGGTPPPPWTGHRDLAPDSMKLGQPNGPAGATGFYVPGGKTWADPGAPPMADLEEQYNIRRSGVDYTPITRVVNGQRQQWVQNTYEAQKSNLLNLGGNAWASTAPNEVTGQLGGTMTGGLGGLNHAITHPWKSISPEELAVLSANNPTVTYYVPDGCGDRFTFKGGVPVGGAEPPPVNPSIIAAPPR